MAFLDLIKNQLKSKQFSSKYSKSYIESLLVAYDNKESWAKNKIIEMQSDSVYYQEEYSNICREIYLKRAENNDVIAFYKLGIIYFNDDKAKSEMYLEKAASLGYVKAMIDLAYRYDDYYNEDSKYGYGTNISKRDYWLDKAIQSNDPESMCIVSNLIFSDRDSLKRTEKEGLDLLEKAINLGYGKAYKLKGDFYKFIKFYDDIEQFKSEDYKRKLIAINAYENAVYKLKNWEDQSDAALQIGLIYGNDFFFGTQKNQLITDTRKSLYWLTIAKFFGNDSAQDYIDKFTNNTSEFLTNVEKIKYYDQFKNDFAKPFYCSECNKTYFFDKNANIVDCPICYLQSRGINL